MDTLIALVIGLYVFFECFTAVNEMPKIKFRHILKEYKNVYGLKYLALGFYGLTIAYNSVHIQGWYVLLILPSTFCVIGRTYYRFKNYQLPYLQLMFKEKDKKENWHENV